MIKMPAALFVAALLFGLPQNAVSGADTLHARNAWTTPHVLTISDGSDPSTLNPHLAQSAAVANLSELTMAWLIRWDEHNRPYPELATAVPSQANGGVSRDGLTITYHLRHGVRWADGAPFTADDVAFSAAVVNNPANDEGARFDQLANVTEPDKYTVIFHLKKPYATFLEAFFSSCCANPSLLPKHLLAKYQNINNVPYNDLPVGIGPFKFLRWDKEKQIVLVANPLYWRGRPKLDKIVYTIQTDREALLADVGAHRVDLWYQFGGAYLDRIRAMPGVAILRHPSYGYSHFDFNLTHPVVRDLAVRQALRFALDRKRIVDDLGHGVGVVQDSGLPITAPYFSDLGTTPYDPAQANVLLDSAGWMRGEDGIRTKNGVKLDLAVAIGSGQSDADKELDMVKSDWAKIGVAIHVNHVSPALYFAPPQQGGIIFGDNSWDMVLFTWAADPYGDYSGNYGCNGFPPAGQNDVRWCNRTAQRAMDAFFGHYKQSERTADDRIVWQEFVRDVPSIVASLREDLFAYNSDLKNYRPNNITPFDNMMNVDI